MNTRRTLLAALLAGAATLAACGGEVVERTDTTEARPAVTQRSTTTERPTTTVRPTTTEATTTTVPPTTTTTAPPEDPEVANARRSAQGYLDYAGFSRQGLIDQLSSEYGDQYPVEAATAAVDSLTVDWNAEAVEAAESYLEFMAFSRQGLIDQLSSEYGHQFTVEQATYGADAALA